MVISGALGQDGMLHRQALFSGFPPRSVGG